MNKQEIIKFLQTNGFKVFPLKNDSKAAGEEWKGEDTKLNYTISDDDNYGYSPISNAGTVIVDFDDKEKFREFAESLIKAGYFVTESGKGWHVPMKGVEGMISKQELWDANTDDTTKDNKLVEFQSPKFYCVGPLSEIYHDKLQKRVTYQPRGELNILDAKKEFHQMINDFCKKFGLIGKKYSKSRNSQLRSLAKDRIPPGKGQSNDYPYQAVLQMRLEGLDNIEIHQELEKIYNEWLKTPAYSGRPWSNWEDQFNRAINAETLPIHGGNRKAEKGEGYYAAAEKFIEEKNLFSSYKEGTVFILDKGYMKNVTSEMFYIIKNELEVVDMDAKEVLSAIISKAPPMPEISKNHIAFKNGMFNIKTKQLEDFSKDRIGIMGYPDVTFGDGNIDKFTDFMNGLFPEEHCRKHAYNAMISSLLPEKDIRMTVCYGGTGTGKSTFRQLIRELLGSDNISSLDDLNYLLSDKYSTAELIDKTCLSCSEAPQSIKEFETLKRLTGEKKIHVRRMRMEGFDTDNRLTIIFDANVLFKVPENQAGPLFRRISLVEFKQRFANRPGEKENIVDEVIVQRDTIITHLLKSNMSPYEDPDMVKNRWEEITTPEKRIINRYIIREKGSNIDNYDLKEKLEEMSEEELDIDTLAKFMKKKGFGRVGGEWKDVAFRKDISEGQTTL